MPVAEKVIRTNAGLASELRLSVMRLRRRLSAERDPSNTLSMGSMAVLAVLDRRGELTIGELAAAERVQPPSMTRTVNCLVKGGYVERHPHPDDGRQVVVRVTDSGRTTIAEDRARRDAWLSRALANLTPAERATLREAAPILHRLAHAD